MGTLTDTRVSSLYDESRVSSLHAFRTWIPCSLIPKALGQSDLDFHRLS